MIIIVWAYLLLLLQAKHNSSYLSSLAILKIVIFIYLLKIDFHTNGLRRLCGSCHALSFLHLNQFLLDAC